MRRPSTVQVVHKQAAQRTHAIAPSVQEEGRHRACKCRRAASGASGGTVPVATDPMHVLRPVVISAPTVASRALGCPLAPWIWPQSTCCAVIGAATARRGAPGCRWMEAGPRAARAPGVSTTRDLCMSCCPAPRTMGGEPMRRDRSRQPRTSHKVAKVQLARRGGARAAAQCSPSCEAAPPRAATAAQPVVGRRCAAEGNVSAVNE